MVNAKALCEQVKPVMILPWRIVPNIPGPQGKSSPLIGFDRFFFFIDLFNCFLNLGKLLLNNSTYGMSSIDKLLFT